MARAVSPEIDAAEALFELSDLEETLPAQSRDLLKGSFDAFKRDYAQSKGISLIAEKFQLERGDVEDLPSFLGGPDCEFTKRTIETISFDQLDPLSQDSRDVPEFFRVLDHAEDDGDGDLSIDTLVKALNADIETMIRLCKNIIELSD